MNCISSENIINFKKEENIEFVTRKNKRRHKLLEAKIKQIIQLKFKTLIGFCMRKFLMNMCVHEFIN